MSNYGGYGAALSSTRSEQEAAPFMPSPSSSSSGGSDLAAVHRVQLRQGGGLCLCTCSIAGVSLCLAMALAALVDPPIRTAVVVPPELIGHPALAVRSVCAAGGFTWNRMEWSYRDGTVDVVGFNSFEPDHPNASHPCVQPLELAEDEYIVRATGFDTTEDRPEYIGCEHRITTSRGRVREWKKEGTDFCPTMTELDIAQASKYDYEAPKCHMITALQWQPKSSPLITGTITAPLLESMRVGRDANCDASGEPVPLFHQRRRQVRRAGAGLVMFFIGIAVGRTVTLERLRGCLCRRRSTGFASI